MKDKNISIDMEFDSIFESIDNQTINIGGTFFNYIENIEKETYEDWYLKISEISDSMKTEEILKSSIFLSCKTLKNAKKTFSEINKLKQMMELSGKSKELSKFLDYIYTLLGDKTLTAHGFTDRLKYVNKEKIWKEIERILISLKELDYELFIISGTLLGYRREGGFIAYDDDVDLAVVLKSSNERDIAKEWLDLRKKLSAMEFIRDYDNVHFKLRSNSLYVAIDLFPAWIENEKAYIYPHTAGELKKNAIFPIKKIRINNVDIFIPNNVDEILSINYGKDWLVPNPAWSFDWSRSKKRFSTFITEYDIIKNGEEK